MLRKLICRIAVCRQSICAIVLAILVMTLATAGGTGQPAAAEGGKPLIVGTKVAPPFAMKDDKGSWTGLSIDLWTAIATEHDRAFEITDFSSNADMIAAAAQDKIDAGVAATTITGEREKIVDFTHPFYQTGLAIAVSSESPSPMGGILRALTLRDFLATVGALIGLLIATGGLLWFFERRRNWDQFNEKPLHGIGDGFWWAAVTMTTVGYGDKAPITPLGRAIAVIWMFAALILTALFTAQLASSLTVHHIAGPVSGPADLPRATVGVLENSASNDYFRDRFISAVPHDSVEHGLRNVKSRRLDAFVHDAPILKYEVLTKHPGEIEILPGIVESQHYGIVLPPASENREAINQALLTILSSRSWRDMRHQYFGSMH